VPGEISGEQPHRETAEDVDRERRPRKRGNRLRPEPVRHSPSDLVAQNRADRSAERDVKRGGKRGWCVHAAGCSPIATRRKPSPCRRLNPCLRQRFPLCAPPFEPVRLRIRRAFLWNHLVQPAPITRALPVGNCKRWLRFMQIIVRDNNVEQALRALQKKLQREGVYREMKLRRHYEKPSEKRAREKAAAVRRARKLERKRAERDGVK